MDKLKSLLPEGINDEMDWKTISKPLVISGENQGFILPNGIKLNTKLSQIWVDGDDLIRKVAYLLQKRVIRPVTYQKSKAGEKRLSFTYKKVDEEQLGIVLSDIK